MADKDTNVPNKNDFISREECIKDLREYEKTAFSGLTVIGCMSRIKRIPAADVRPVVRAHWIETAPINKETGVPFFVNKPHFKCSNCGSIDFPWNYCHNCGADMREPQILKNAIQNADADVITPAT